MRLAVFTVLMAGALAGCAPAIHNLQRQTARGITPTPYPDSVTISDVRSSARTGTTTWVATTPSGVFDCSIEGDEHSALCVKRAHPN